MCFFFFSSRRRHTRCYRDWSSDVCSSDLAEPRHDHREEPLAVAERERAQVEPSEREEIEGEERRGSLERRALDVGASRERRPVAERGRGRAAVRVEDDELPVHERTVVELLEGARDLGKDRRRIAAARVPQLRAPAALPREDPVPVVARLEEPSRASGRPGGVGRGHGPAPSDMPGARAEPPRLPGGARRAVLAGGKLLEQEAREDRLLGDLPPRPGVRVPVLDQEPALLSALVAASPHERPLPAQLLAGKLEHELPAREALARIGPRGPRAPVPHDDGARPVVARRDEPLEVRVLDRMVLDLDGHPLVGWVVGRALRHRPAPERAVELETEVPVEPPRGVLLHDEQPRRERVVGANTSATEWLGGAPRVALLAVTIEPVGHATEMSARPPDLDRAFEPGPGPGRTGPASVVPRLTEGCGRLPPPYGATGRATSRGCSTSLSRRCAASRARGSWRRAEGPGTSSASRSRISCCSAPPPGSSTHTSRRHASGARSDRFGGSSRKGGRSRRCGSRRTAPRSSCRTAVRAGTRRRVRSCSTSTSAISRSASRRSSGPRSTRAAAHRSTRTRGTGGAATSTTQLRARRRTPTGERSRSTPPTPVRT